jgi:cold shock CspA family protein
MNDAMYIGTVCYYNAISGNGFLVSGKELGKIPFSYHAIQLDGYRSLEEGERVGYMAVKTNQGVVAAKIFLVE